MPLRAFFLIGGWLPGTLALFCVLGCLHGIPCDPLEAPQGYRGDLQVSLLSLEGLMCSLVGTFGGRAFFCTGVRFAPGLDSVDQGLHFACLPSSAFCLPGSTRRCILPASQCLPGSACSSPLVAFCSLWRAYCLPGAVFCYCCGPRHTGMPSVCMGLHKNH